VEYRHSTHDRGSECKRLLFTTVVLEQSSAFLISPISIKTTTSQSQVDVDVGYRFTIIEILAQSNQVASHAWPMKVTHPVTV
jgi:hypothetical protein